MILSLGYQGPTYLVIEQWQIEHKRNGCLSFINLLSLALPQALDDHPDRYLVF